jgi:hypothetical protein
LRQLLAERAGLNTQTGSSSALSITFAVLAADGQRSPTARLGKLWRSLALRAVHEAALCGTEMQSAASPGTR